MKKVKIVAVLAIAFCFLLGTTAVYAADGDGDTPYTYKLTVSAGNGTFDKDPDAGTAATITTGTGEVDVDGTTSTLIKMPDGVAPEKSKYFVTGMKIAGYDNGEGSDYVFSNSYKVDIYGESALPSFKEKDTELVVAYGLKSNMVKYTVTYVDQNGAALPGVSSDTHYGAIGDSPIVSYKHVDGYVPHAYNVTLELKANEAENVFVFYYTPVTAAEGQTIVNNAGNANAAGGNAAGGNAGANAGGNAAAAPGTATIGDADTPLAIDDQDTPLAANPDEEEGGGPGAFPFIIGGVIAAGIIAAIAAILARRKGDEVE